MSNTHDGIKRLLGVAIGVALNSALTAWPQAASDAKEEPSVPAAATGTPKPVACKGEACAPICVIDYGAVPDDTLDDTAAIQAAIDAAPEGGHVHIPAGHYLLNDTLRIHEKSLTVTGDPAHPFADTPVRGGTFLQQTVDDKHVLEIFSTTYSPDGARHITLRDFALYGPGPNWNKTGDGIHVDANVPNYPDMLLYIRISGVGVRRMNGHGLYLVGSLNGAYISNVWAADCGLNGIHVSRYVKGVAGGAVNESYWEHIDTHSNGKTATSLHDMAGFFFNLGGMGANVINRLSSGSNRGSGVILGRGNVVGLGWHFESNGYQDPNYALPPPPHSASLPGVVNAPPVILLGFKDHQGGTGVHEVESTVISGVVIYYLKPGPNGTYHGDGIKVDYCKDATLSGLHFNDHTDQYDVNITANAKNTKLFGVARGNSATDVRKIHNDGKGSIISIGVDTNNPGVPTSPLNLKDLPTQTDVEFLQSGDLYHDTATDTLKIKP